MNKDSSGERRFRIPRPQLGTILGGLALMVALGGVAHSAVPSPTGVIHACYVVDDADPDFSYVYISEHDFACQPGEERLTWNQEGADQEKVAAALAEAAKYDTRQQITALVEARRTIDKTKPPKLKDSRALKRYTRTLSGKSAKFMGEYVDDLKNSQRAQARYNKQHNQINKLMLESLQEGVDEEAVLFDVLMELGGALSATP